MTRRIFTAVAVMMAAAGMAFAAGNQEQGAAPGTALPGTALPGAGPWMHPGVGPGMGPGFMDPEDYVDADGVLITAVLEDGAAQAAGLERGDVILSIDGTDVSTVAELRARIEGMRAGQDVDLRVQSGDEIATVAVTLDDRYAMPPLGIRGAGSPGARHEAMSAIGATIRGGTVRILDVSEGSPAEEAGIEPGFIITGIDGEIAAGETITVSYIDADLAEGFYRFDDEEGPEVETATLTVGEEDGRAYVGVRYAPLGPGFGFRFDNPRGADDAWGRGMHGGPGMRGGPGVRDGGPGVRGGRGGAGTWGGPGVRGGASAPRGGAFGASVETPRATAGGVVSSAGAWM